MGQRIYAQAMITSMQLFSQTDSLRNERTHLPLQFPVKFDNRAETCFCFVFCWAYHHNGNAMLNAC